MFPFKRRSETNTFNPGGSAAPLRAFRDIGDTFNYLGRECIVTSHGRIVSEGFAMFYQAELCADYCDNDGVIRQLRFSLNELPGLIKQNGGKP